MRISARADYALRAAAELAAAGGGPVKGDALAAAQAIPAKFLENILAVEGPLASVRGEAPEDVEYPGAAKDLQDIWIAVRAAVRGVVEHVTLADLAAGDLPEDIRRLGEDPDARIRR
jgi:DNA-binding IscR family transcriptional regulator